MIKLIYINKTLYTFSILSIAAGAIIKNSELIIYYQIFLSYSLLFIYIISKKDFPANHYIAIYCIIILSCGVLNLLKTFPSGIYTLSTFLSALLIALMGKRFLPPATISDKVIIALSSYIVISLFLGESIETLLLHSKNYISIYTLFFLICYFFECDRAKKNPNNFPIILTIIMSIVSISSSGIIVAVLLAILVVFSRKIGFYNFLITSLISVSLILYFGAIFEIYAELVGALLSHPEEALKIIDLERLSGGDDRFAAWASYVNEISISELIYGRLWPNSLSIFSSISLHNSFFQSHSMFGILSVIAVSYWFIIIIKLAKFNWKMSFILFVWFIRSAADSIFLSGTYFDFLILAIPVACLSSYKKFTPRKRLKSSNSTLTTSSEEFAKS